MYAKLSSAIIAMTFFNGKASHTQKIIFDHTLPLMAYSTLTLYYAYVCDVSVLNWKKTIT